LRALQVVIDGPRPGAGVLEAAVTAGTFRPGGTKQMGTGELSGRLVIEYWKRLDR
jgi:hypothetical protein